MKRVLALLSILLLMSVASAQTPSLTVSPQELMDGAVSIDSVTLAEDGFVVVHAFDMNGELVLTPPLGLTYLAAGTHENVAIELDAALLEANGYGMGEKNVLPMIHVDDGNQTYEFPEGPDVPVMVNDAMVVAELPVMMGMMDDMGEMMTPMLSVSAQTAMGTTITIDSVTLAEDGFVVVHAYDTNGDLVLTPPLGLTYLTAGTHDSVAIELDATLLAENGYGMDAKNVLPMVHVDDGDQMYEFPDGPDVPVMVNEEMVVANLELTWDTMMMDDSEEMMDDSEEMMDDSEEMADGEMSDDMSDDTMDMMGEGSYEISLSGSQEVPAVMTDATGSATATLSGNTLTVSGDFAGLSSPYAASHVHMAAMGENGDVIFPLNATVAADGMSGIFIGSAELDEAQLNAFMAGHLYVNIHSEMHGGGELRGQIVSESMMMSMMGTPMLSVSDQTAANSVTIDSVTLAEDGFVVVHAYDMNGDLVLTPPLGLTYLTAGTHENVMIDLDAGLLADNGYNAMGAKNVLPMIHVDDGDQAYEFPDGPDVPVMVNDEMVVANLALTLQ